MHEDRYFIFPFFIFALVPLVSGSVGRRYYSSFYASRVRLGGRGVAEVGETKKLERGTWESTGATNGMEKTIKGKMVAQVRFPKEKTCVGLCLSAPPCLSLSLSVCVRVCVFIEVGKNDSLLEGVDK